MELKGFYLEAEKWLFLHGAKLLISIIILLVGLKLIKILGVRLRGRMGKRKVHSSLQPFFLSLAITALYILLIILVMNILGYSLAILHQLISHKKKADLALYYSLYFKLFGRKIQEYEIQLGNMYNMDEKGFLIGCLNNLC